MPKRNFNLEPRVDKLLEQYHAKQKAINPRITRQEIVNEAIKLYCLMEQRDTAEEMFEKSMEHRFQKYENRIASMIAAVGVDVAMILSETLETLAAYEENKNKAPSEVYSELRQEGVALFNRHRSFKLDSL
ncbi:hypothetical protein [Alicyclobacillus fodiniaquatilis]|uniref:Uncharacterized protein n=1 Tax=Alicyclobacillus fodiniaquatilis TaxID=1661150 RepID=A0ABW4JCW7_9BACL